MSGRSRAYAWFRDPRWPPAPPLFELRARLPPASERPVGGPLGVRDVRVIYVSEPWSTHPLSAMVQRAGERDAFHRMWTAEELRQAAREHVAVNGTGWLSFDEWRQALVAGLPLTASIYAPPPRAPPGFLYAGWSKGFMGATEGGFMLGVDLAVPGGDRTTTYPPIKATGPVACLHCGTRTRRHTAEVHLGYTGHYCCGEPGCDVTDATHAIDPPDVELETR